MVKTTIARKVSWYYLKEHSFQDPVTLYSEHSIQDPVTVRINSSQETVAVNRSTDINYDGE